MDLSSRQRKIFWIAAAVCALTRFASMARSLWDWDEALFSLGMREYDVASHHPHPPGFPVFIAVAKIVRLVASSDFRALQSISLVAGMLAFPAVFLLARELRMRFETSLVAAALFVFFPNVWFFGGTAFSDVPSIVLVIWAVVFLFRGARSRRDYWIGTALLALAAGIRPQNLVIGLFPGILAMRRRPLRDSVVALLIGVTICGVAYGSAVIATGDLERYMTAVRAHGEYISRVDSFRSEARPPLWRIADRFFIKNYQSTPLSLVTSLFVMVSAVGSIRSKHRPIVWNLLTFGPFALMAWLLLDRFSISRFSIGYAPMFALLAADGIARMATFVWRRAPSPAELAIGGSLVAAFILWTFPAFTAVRNEIAPPVAAATAVAESFDPARQQLFVAYSMVPFMEYFAPSYPVTRVMDDRAIPLTPAANPFLLAEMLHSKPGGRMYERGRDRLWNIARRHYFEVVLKPMTNVARFESGWFEAEGEGYNEWRVMGDATAVVLLPSANGATELALLLDIPDELFGSALTISLNGAAIERVVMTDREVSREYPVTGAPGGAVNRLEITSDRLATIDGRPRGPRLRFLSWGPD
ncbi:MAG: glycosyltransferase family 39 protein [Thermoanaerobaculia bacterium]|nr:glycosyltransferase family 39 protein [Thermoanaerobaculia bacterium]